MCESNANGSEKSNGRPLLRWGSAILCGMANTHAKPKPKGKPAPKPAAPEKETPPPTPVAPVRVEDGVTEWL